MQEKQKENLAGTFLEIAREHVGKKKDTYIQWCEQCGESTEHTCIDKGLDEIYTCVKGGHIHAVRVR